MLALLLLLLSLLFLSFGIYRLKGPVSVWYLAYGVANVEVNYLAIPIGTTLALWSLAVSPLIPESLQLTIMLAGAACLFVGTVLSNRLFKPSWLRWLEREHGKLIPLLQSEIQRIGPDQWDKEINTQIELNEWVSKMKKKYSW
jgi:hypothetical protein